MVTIENGINRLEFLCGGYYHNTNFPQSELRTNMRERDNQVNPEFFFFIT